MSECEQRQALDAALDGISVPITQDDRALGELLYTARETGVLDCEGLSASDALKVAKIVALAITMKGKCPDHLRM